LSSNDGEQSNTQVPLGWHGEDLLDDRMDPTVVAIAYLPLILGRVTRQLKAIFQYNQRQGSLIEEPL
jgi:hypothetical protein